MLRAAHFIAFSGHRPDSTHGRTETDLSNAAPRLHQTIVALREKVSSINGEIHLISSLAAGGDIIACETALSLGIPIHIVLAKPEPAFLQAFFHEEPDKDLSHWLPRAHAILATIRPDPDFPSVAVNPSHTIRNGGISTTSPQCYAEANTRLLAPADLLLTLSNLQPSKSIAGTTHLIAQATAIGIPTLNLNPADSPDTLIPGIPDGFANPTCDSLSPFEINNPHVTCDLSAAGSPFAALAKCLSSAAGKSARWFRSASAIAITCHIFATVLAAAVAAFYYALKTGKLNEKDIDPDYVHWSLAILAFCELIFVFTGWRLERRLHEDKAQQTWLHCRFARELMRSMEKSNPFLDPLYPEIQRHQPNWKRFAITTGLMLRAEKNIPAYPTADQITTWRNDYLKGRVQDQETFFHRKSHGAKIPHQRFHFLTHWSGIAALIVVFCACVVKISHVFDKSADSKPISDDHDIIAYIVSAFFLLFLPILMPLLASVGASFGAVFDYGRRSARYHEIAKDLGKTARILPTLETLPDITTVVRNTEEVLLDELIEWFAAQRKGLGH